MLLEFVLHVDFFGLVSGKGGVEAEKVFAGELCEKWFVVKIGGAVALSEEEPVASFRLVGEALLEEGSEGGHACAGADQDDRVIGRGETKSIGRLDVEGDGGGFESCLLTKEVAGDAVAGFSLLHVGEEGDGEMNFIREDFGR